MNSDEQSKFSAWELAKQQALFELALTVYPLLFWLRYLPRFALFSLWYSRKLGLRAHLEREMWMRWQYPDMKILDWTVRMARLQYLLANNQNDWRSKNNSIMQLWETSECTNWFWSCDEKPTGNQYNWKSSSAIRSGVSHHDEQ